MVNWGYNPTYRGCDPIYNWFLGPPCNSLIPLKYGDSRRNPFDIQTVEGPVY